jgi:DNA topoisomerase-1
MTQLEKLQQSGIRRLGSLKSGFRYRTADGKAPPREALERIRKLVLPPAWTEVHIAPSPRARLQAIGKDKRGRWQYRYHPDHVKQQEKRKYRRLLEFVHDLPALRRRLEQDLRAPGLGHDKVMAVALRIMSCCFLRPGSSVYATENGSFGIATLRRKHVTVRGDTVTFDFPGKSGKRQVRMLRDRRIARVLRQLIAAPGHEVFKYLTDDGVWVDIRRRDINAHLRDVMGARFTAKDFRTWAGTLICASALARIGETLPKDASTRERQKKVREAIRETADHLGNTPAVCRSSYIYPSVLQRFEKGQVLDAYFQSVEELARYKGHALHRSERALVRFLEGKTKRRPTRGRAATNGLAAAASTAAP